MLDDLPEREAWLDPEDAETAEEMQERIQRREEDAERRREEREDWQWENR